MPIDRRKEPRYDMPGQCQQYIRLTVKHGTEHVPARIGDFSRNGILFEYPHQLNTGDRTECTLRVNFLVEKEISFGIEVKYCFENAGSFTIGASIYSVSEEIWLNYFEEICDFVVRRGKS